MKKRMCNCKLYSVGVESERDELCYGGFREEGKRVGSCIYEKEGLFLIWWGIAPAKNSEGLANRKSGRDKE